MDYRKLLHIPQNCFHKLVNNHLSLLGVAASLPLFGMATAFAVAQNGAQPAKPEVLQKEVTEQLTLPAFSFNESATRYWRDEAIQRGDTIARVLNRLGIRDSEASRFLHSSPLSKDLLKLKTGATLSVQTTDLGELFGLRFLNDDENGEQVLVAIEKVNGEWQASADPIATEAVQTVRSLPITRSVGAALAKAQVPRDIRAQLTEIFADQFNINSLGKGDRINLVYETLLYNGAPIAAGNLLAVEIKRSGKLHQAYYFAHDSESGAYYDAQGKPIKQGFSHQPVANARISSGFGFRKHPILRSLRLHSGVDYAAASGTPIIAPADGTLIKVERQNGYGNMVEIRHNQKMTTLYAHMSQFAKGARAGKSVKAGDVIGYVGSTGRSTGPHLHFEVRINGQAVDPATNALPTPGLSSTQLAEFKSGNRQLTAHLQLLRELPTNIALLD